MSPRARAARAAALSSDHAARKALRRDASTERLGPEARAVETSGIVDLPSIGTVSAADLRPLCQHQPPAKTAEANIS
jgi:hypothetical protein